MLDPYSEETQEMPESRSTVLPRHQKKDRWERNEDKTNITHVKMKCNRGPHPPPQPPPLGRSEEKLPGQVSFSPYVCVLVANNVDPD